MARPPQGRDTWGQGIGMVGQVMPGLVKAMMQPRPPTPGTQTVLGQFPSATQGYGRMNAGGPGGITMESLPGSLLDPSQQGQTPITPPPGAMAGMMPDWLQQLLSPSPAAQPPSILAATPTPPILPPGA